MRAHWWLPGQAAAAPWDMVDRAPGSKTPHDAQKGALGPRGRGLFDRLFGGLRHQMAPRREGVALAVASGKGGTGKSFVATSLSVLLHRSGRSTTLVDCDFGLACDHLLMGVKPQLTLQELLFGRATLGQVRVATSCGPFLLPGASGVRRMADLSDRELLVLGRELGALCAMDDAIVLDLGAGIAPQTVLGMLAADHILLVTQPEIAALVDAYAVVKCVAQLRPQARILVIVNRVAAAGRGEQAFQKLTEVSRQNCGIELHYLGEVVDDPRVGQHRLGQLPLVATDPDCNTTRSLQRIAQRLEQMTGPLERRELPAEAGFEARFREHRLFL